MTMTDERLAELDAVMAKATGEPWFLGDGGVCGHEPIMGGNVVCLEPENRMRASLARWPDNAAAIVALHNAYPDLRAMIDAQAATIARLREALGRLADVTDDPFTFNGCKMQCARTARRDARAALTGAA